MLYRDKSPLTRIFHTPLYYDYGNTKKLKLFIFSNEWFFLPPDEMMAGYAMDEISFGEVKKIIISLPPVKVGIVPITHQIRIWRL